MSLILLGIAFLVLLSVLLILASAKSKKESEKMLGGKVVYSDLIYPGKVLVSRTHGIVGKPDYVLKRENLLIPVEVKSSPPPEKPYRGHVLQLAAYCLLIEENYGVRVPYGYIEYAGGKRFRVDFDDELRIDLAMTIGCMRDIINAERKPKPESDPRKCASCSVRKLCPHAKLEK